MLQPGPARKVTIHLNEDTAAKRDFLYNEIFAFLYAAGVSGATLSRPAAGFGFHHRVHRHEGDHFASEHMPVRIEFIDRCEVIDSVLPKICEMLTDGIIEAQDIVIYKAAVGQEPVV